MSCLKTLMLAGLATTVLTAPAAFAAPAPSAAQQAAVTDSRRPEADRARDAGRKPAETLAFAGVVPGAKVAELSAGGGWYTRVLAGAVGPRGKVYVIAAPCRPDRPTCLDGVNAAKAAYGNVEIIMGDNLTYKTPEPVDVVWTTESYHDFHNGPTANIAALNKNAFDNLKPGGVFFVEDHAAAPGAGLKAATHTPPDGKGRMDEAIAKAEVTAAGFTFDGESNHLRNPADDKNGPAADNGPSTSERFAFRFRKPR